MNGQHGEQQNQQEIEWQFDAIDVRPVERWLVERDGTESPVLAVAERSVRQIVDRYLDTDDWRIFRAGYALRLRVTGERVEATLKRLESGSADYRMRQEITQAVSAPDPEELTGELGPVSERVTALIGTRRLRTLFTFETRRQAFPLTMHAAPAGELTLDDTAIVMGPGMEPIRLRRVEIEVPEQAVAQVEPFVAELRAGLGLGKAPVSKFEAGLIAHGYQPPEAIDLGPTKVEPSMTMGEVAFAVLRKHLAAFLAREPGTRLGDDIEELHDMRVAARRLRAALSLFRDTLPLQAEHVSAELRWVAGALGDVRDLDVQLEQLAGWIEEADPEDRESLGAVADLLRQRRAVARRAMLEVLDSPRYEAFTIAFQAMLRRGHGQGHGHGHGPITERTAALGTEPALALAPPLIARRYRKLRKRGDAIDSGSPPEAYHELRIQGKRLRYALEFLSPLYGKPAQRMIASLVALQDLLGGHQDAYVAIDFLRGLAIDSGAHLPGGAIFAMGRIAQRYADEARAARRQFPDRYAAVTGKSWKQLQKAMERG